MTEKIELIVYDFDGVMTDNRVLVFQDGHEAVMCNRADGLGIGMIRDLGIPQIIISTESNPVVQARAEKVHLDVLQNISDKKAALRQYCDQFKYNLSNVLFVGNDINDLEAMEIAGIPVCPSDAHDRIRNISKIVLNAKGGAGVIRELADMLYVNDGTEKKINVSTNSTL